MSLGASEVFETGARHIGFVALTYFALSGLSTSPSGPRACALGFIPASLCG